MAIIIEFLTFYFNTSLIDNCFYHYRPHSEDEKNEDDDNAWIDAGSNDIVQTNNSEEASKKGKTKREEEPNHIPKMYVRVHSR